MSKSKVIFIDTVHPVLAERLEEAGYDCQWLTDLSREEILERIHDFEGAVIRSKFKFDKEILDKAINLKWIARSGAGMENIDVTYAQSKGVKCYNSPEGNRDAVAEHALGMLLSLFNHLNKGDREVRAAQWKREENRGVELKGKTVGILGYGYMGEAFSQRLQGFGVEVIAYDKYKKGFGNERVKEVDEDEFFQRTEVLSIHLPLTDETRFLVDKDYLNRFSKNIYLINTARGKNLKTSDLLNALDSGKVLGACLDVLEFESVSFEKLDQKELPASFQELINNEKVILSPHVAGWTLQSYRKLSEVLAKKILGRSI